MAFSQSLSLVGILLCICSNLATADNDKRAPNACTTISCKSGESCQNGVCVQQDRCKTLRCSNGCRDGYCIDAAYTQTTSRVRSTVCSNTVCGECERCVVNGVGAARCIFAEGCCPATSRLNSCFVDPCLDFKSSCSSAVYCVAVTCDGCSTRLYDREFNLLSATSCPATGPRHFRSYMKLPEYDPSYKTVKPGSCPMESSWIIAACVQECSSDSDCSGMNKCCTDGCARRCSRPITDGTNYLSFPIRARKSGNYAAVERFQKN
uniref:WAP domain-containing protein n=1 Tax=Plectus sambesii TaxID=2011161 RepID=A0A914XQE3_9BILA